MPGAVEQGLAAGFLRYLTKPLDPKALAEALDSALRGDGPARS
jgi:CheY-like chemotaxis protein